ncbi:hypothetical protein AX774_g4352 [Zancudomyces culisetae]|uniref:Uncharacterized protein n=1 Tax=Zancudomyces culisetae TaxID=1213189 RepID=A0A1R1PMI3_ZANCU|nr:hypothetical protein AX774_g4352 [Zancudomyces culisetae]|eukprot:OMH82174.1 hypothetical protein AX774_g4352 [Zancudomyces culisetae]
MKFIHEKLVDALHTETCLKQGISLKPVKFCRFGMLSNSTPFIIVLIKFKCGTTTIDFVGASPYGPQSYFSSL